jgi:hypothetical protein
MELSISNALSIALSTSLGISPVQKQMGDDSRSDVVTQTDTTGFNLFFRANDVRVRIRSLLGNFAPFTPFDEFSPLTDPSQDFSPCRFFRIFPPVFSCFFLFSTFDPSRNRSASPHFPNFFTSLH